MVVPLAGLLLKGPFSTQSPLPNLIIKEYGFACASPLKGCGAKNRRVLRGSPFQQRILTRLTTMPPSQLWQGFQSKAPSVRCYRPPFQSKGRPVERGHGAGKPFQSSVERAVRATPFQSRALVERAMMISVSKQSTAVKWQPFQSNRASAT